MFDNIVKFFKKLLKNEQSEINSKDSAKERLHLVLMQDRANVSADFLDLMKQEIIEVIKKYIDVEENSIDVRLTNQTNEDGTNGAPALYANIPIISIKEQAKKVEEKTENKDLEADKKKIKSESVEDEKVHDEVLEEEHLEEKQPELEQLSENEEQELDNKDETINKQETQNEE